MLKSRESRSLKPSAVPDTGCLGCGGANVTTLLNFGPQPPSNRFAPAGRPDPDTHPLCLGQCGACGLLQLIDPMPVEMVRSRYPWLTYSEPEGHLDALVEQLAELVGANARIVGLTATDDSVLARLNRLGYPHTVRYDMGADLGIQDPCAGLETVQAAVDDALIDRLAAKHGKADLLIVRYVLEHAHEPRRFLRSLARLLTPGGRIVVEVPDCRKFIGACDYSFVWEEHICYYSPNTLTMLLRASGFRDAKAIAFPHALEDSLVAIGEPCGQDPLVAASAVAPELVAAQRFAAAFDATRLRLRSHFESLRKRGKRIAIFGAGHLAAKFLNIHGLNSSVDCVIDDNPHKQALRMPGSGLPIAGSARLTEFDLCLLSLSPESEQKILAKLRPKLKEGGGFASIFALSPLAIELAESEGGMPNLHKVNDEVFVSQDPIVRIGPRELAFLKAQALTNARHRVRICAHKTNDDPLHEMVIAISALSYIHPHKHSGKSESFHIIEGAVDVVVFDDDGTLTDLIELGDSTTGRAFFYRLAQSKFHALLLKTAFLVVHEVTNGPFVRENTLLAPWAPTEDHLDEARDYMARVAQLAAEYKLRPAQGAA